MDLLNYKKRLINESYPEDFLDEMEILLNEYLGRDFTCAFFESFFESRERKSLRFNSYKIVRDYLAERGDLDLLNSLSQEEYLNLADIAVNDYAEKFFTTYAISDKVAKVSWSSYGYYYPKSVILSKCLEYQAGYFYIQEASAMIPGEILAKKVFAKNVADLCAAPGGKSLRLAEGIVRDGLLLSNDYSRSRAKVLRFNLRQLGLNNVAVISSDPTNMLNQMRESFDAIILDAPCSGEGMMRRNKESRQARSKYPIKDLVDLQAKLLDTASKLIKEGAYLLYSTCTFNAHENEEQIINFLRTHNDFKIEKIDSELIVGNNTLSKGLAIDGNSDLHKAVRVFPNVAEGDGHFAILLRKYPLNSSNSPAFSNGTDTSDTFASSVRQNTLTATSRHKSKADSKLNRNKVKSSKAKRGQELSIEAARLALENFISKNLTEDIYKILGRAFFYQLDLVDNTVILRQEKDLFASSKDIHVLYSGMSFGELKFDKKSGAALLPNHDLCLSFPKSIFKVIIDCCDEKVLTKFVNGQTLSFTDLNTACREQLCLYEADYILFSYRGMALGMLKRQGKILKNLYPKYLHGKLGSLEVDSCDE